MVYFLYIRIILLRLVHGTATESFSKFLTKPDPFYFGDDYDDCDTELVVIDNDGHPSTHSTPGGFVAGGFT